MRHFNFLTAIAIGLTFLCSSQSNAEDFDDTIIAFEIGYRYDNLNFTSRDYKRQSIAIEKQHWKDISTMAFGISASTYTEYNVFIKGKLDYGKVYHANLRIDNPFFNSLDRFHQWHTGGNTYAANIAVGFPIWFNCTCDWLHFIPLVGFDYDRLKLRGHERIHTPGLCDEFSSSSSTSSYRVRRCFVKSRFHNRVKVESPFAGIDFVATCCR